MITTYNFNSVVAKVVALGATKKRQVKIYHTWYGWLSKGVLHITSHSGARQKDIWHFSIQANAGCNLFFKNTINTADCWTKSAGENELERVIFKINPMAKIEYVDELNHVLYTRGSRCDHSTSNHGHWWLLATDGDKKILQEARLVQNHYNQYHIGCPIESDQVLVTGGTYALNWDTQWYIKLFVTKKANLNKIAREVCRSVLGDGATPEMVWAEESGKIHDWIAKQINPGSEAWTIKCKDGSEFPLYVYMNKIRIKGKYQYPESKNAIARAFNRLDNDEIFGILPEKQKEFTKALINKEKAVEWLSSNIKFFRVVDELYYATNEGLRKISPHDIFPYGALKLLSRHKLHGTMLKKATPMPKVVNN